MECIYNSDFKQGLEKFQLEQGYIKHLRALRLAVNQKIMLTNGCGISGVCLLSEITNNSYKFIVEKYLHDFGELPSKFGLAIGLLSDRNRFEFALEKAVEMGVTDFYPLLTKYTEKKLINKERLQSKALSAMEQCKRSKLINIHEPLELKKIISQPESTEETNTIFADYERIILADENGENPDLTKSLTSTICFVGPEGGFSSEEIELIKKIDKTICWNLGNRRLRAETAAVSILSFASVKIRTF